ncbi:phosphatidate cytidylyltransferase [Lentilactobacillus kisonensis]|uniref:Phosphatidate cytidylyltransferase n=3 Tax=Lentilactobacillus TaxID=2767893 RepID=H1LJH3_9LACO|nr:phosphatidate cytidylyltransferase [Lentilactobacillus kisonensis]EHO48545.1 phosphatidate cytidylyltransferase [Lentilactobacillus kisonensis F0435]KRL23309.1 phosphatidate cytidylyltransferase [Lentilactobacillus kisonensis DSM 19906 = JCM 15041]
MRQRVITAVVALIIFIPIIILGHIWIDIAAMALGIVAVSEVLIMKKRILVSAESIIAYLGVSVLILPDTWTAILPGKVEQNFVFFLFVLMLLLLTVFSKNLFTFDDAGVISLGMLYVGMGFHYFILARGVSLIVLLYALFIVWSTDSGAYIFGRLFGKHKLAPRISPNKTWEGSVYGSLAATVICSIFVFFFPIEGYSLLQMIIITVILSIAGQFGDLIESALKRYYGVKDSGKILPGHGGILDRFDSLLFVLPMLHLVGII